MTETEVAVPEPEIASASPLAEAPPARRWLALAWFLLGVLVGIVAFAAYTQQTAPTLTDTVAIREAARAGTLDAIATLQAGGSPAESSAPSSPVVVKTAFAVRPANQIGNVDSQVTIVEFSDFQ